MRLAPPPPRIKKYWFRVNSGDTAKNLYVMDLTSSNFILDENITRAPFCVFTFAQSE